MIATLLFAVAQAYIFWVAGYPFDWPIKARVVHETYASRENPALALDLYLPVQPAASPPPVVVGVHGGLWWAGSTAFLKPLARDLAAHGQACALIEFSRDPAHGFVTQVEQIKDAVRYLRANAQRLGIDGSRIGLFGLSSGAQLAALAGLAQDGDGYSDDPPGQSSRVQAMVLGYGTYDFQQPPKSEFGLLLNGLARAFFDPAPPNGLTPAAFASPVTFVHAAAPPVRLLYGDLDTVTPPSQSLALASCLQAKGVLVETQCMEGYGHGFWECFPWLWPELFATTEDYFARMFEQASVEELEKMERAAALIGPRPNL